MTKPSTISIPGLISLAAPPSGTTVSIISVVNVSLTVVYINEKCNLAEGLYRRFWIQLLRYSYSVQLTKSIQVWYTVVPPPNQLRFESVIEPPWSQWAFKQWKNKFNNLPWSDRSECHVREVVCDFDRCIRGSKSKLSLICSKCSPINKNSRNGSHSLGAASVQKHFKDGEGWACDK